MAAGGRKNADASLALALAGGDTVAEAASKAGVSERTAFRRLLDPAFRRRVAELRAAAMERASSKLADTMTQAAETLRALLRADSEAVRLGACRSILELAGKLRENIELEERVTMLEKQLGRGNR
jgi:hypothetical protein